MNARLFLLAGAALAIALAGPARAASADNAALPGTGFAGDRYVSLWTKSPFAIATPEAAPTSQDYQLVGLAQFDGVSYASLVEKGTQEHFVLASDKPVKDLKLVSIAHGSDGGSAVIQRNGELLTLKQEGAPAPAPGQAPMSFPNAPPMAAVPTMNRSVGGMPGVFFRHPQIRIHRLPITVPGRPPPH